MRHSTRTGRRDQTTLNPGADRLCMLRLCAQDPAGVALNKRMLPRGRSAANEVRPDAERLASMNMLVAGLGHDIGNLLPIVGMHLDTLEHMDLPEAALQDIHAIAETYGYLKKLFRGFRLFMDPVSTSPAVIETELASWWADVAPFMRNVLPRSIQLAPGSFADLPRVSISPTALTQVVYNLLQNAGDAMNARGAGRISISATVAEDGERITLCVADDGPGMSAEVLRRCLEPFFTTKPQGATCGLGLALVKSAVHSAGGTVIVQSQAGNGTVFLLTLQVSNPRTDGPERFHIRIATPSNQGALV